MTNKDLRNLQYKIKCYGSTDQCKLQSDRRSDRLYKGEFQIAAVLADIVYKMNIKNGRMDLFDQTIDKHKNWLPYEGTVNYCGKLLSKEQADFYLNRLLETIAWRNDEANIFGKKIITKRKVAWYGEKPYEYTYSNTTKQALYWTRELLELKLLIEKETGESFNSCLLNLYHNEDEGMAWHSDAEIDLKKNGAIASLSFGAERKFALKHKQSKEKVALLLEHGSLLVMKGTTQTHGLHSLPPSKKITTVRINLTFRTIAA
jgi:alkylated DNA repair dioxygenase AlkB